MCVCVDKYNNFKFKISVMHRSLAKQDKFNLHIYTVHQQYQITFY